MACGVLASSKRPIKSKIDTFRGIHAFYTPRSHPDGVDVNVRCLDGDAMARFTVTPFGGADWEANIEKIR